MDTIIIQRPKSNSLNHQLVSLIQLRDLCQNNPNSKLDFRNISFIYPPLILPLSIYIQQYNLIPINLSPEIQSYLNTIGFNHIHQKYPSKTKSYLPIIKFSTNNSQLASKYRALLVEFIDNKSNTAKTNISYLIEEALDNIAQHSQSEFGYMLAQVYPKSNFIDINIADTGIGIQQSYSNFIGENISFEKTVDLLFEKHFSTKDNYERGTGIRDSKKFIQQGLKGSYALLSGNIFAFAAGNNFQKFNLKDYEFYWQGVLVSMRIPIDKIIKESLYNYIQ